MFTRACVYTEETSTTQKNMLSPRIDRIPCAHRNQKIMPRSSCGPYANSFLHPVCRQGNRQHWAEWSGESGECHQDNDKSGVAYGPPSTCKKWCKMLLLFHAIEVAETSVREAQVDMDVCGIWSTVWAYVCVGNKYDSGGSLWSNSTDGYSVSVESAALTHLLWVFPIRHRFRRDDESLLPRENE